MSAAPAFEAYFDFDHTIAEIDLLDDLIQRFSIDDEWQQVEASWVAGTIGSRECLERQLDRVRLSAAELDQHLLTVKIDPGFRRIVQLMRARGVELVIVSDSFEPIIRRVLAHHGLAEIPILANELRIEGDRWRLGFPYFASICTRCANCKTSHLMRRGRAPEVRKIYVGDGRSDICPAGFCEVLFAKSTLLAHYQPLRRDVIPFERLDEVYTHLLQLLK